MSLAYIRPEHEESAWLRDELPRFELIQRVVIVEIHRFKCQKLMFPCFRVPGYSRRQRDTAGHSNHLSHLCRSEKDNIIPKRIRRQKASYSPVNSTKAPVADSRRSLFSS
jgi:hypothetical protein